MKIISKIINKFKTVYCEDCEHSFVQEGCYLTKGKNVLCCRKAPTDVDCTGKRDYVQRKKPNIIHTYKWCRFMRNKPYCFKFSPKNSVDK